MNVDRMYILPNVTDAKSNSLARFGDQRVRPGKDAAIKTEEVEIGHDRGIGAEAARWDVPFVEENGEVSVHFLEVGVLGVNDEESHGSQTDLDHFISVGVIHLGSGVLIDRKLVNEGLSRRYGRLAETAHSVHSAR